MQWRACTEYHSKSWWQTCVTPYAGEQVPAHTLFCALPTIEAAPGRSVLVNLF
ncbi:hypothetical protein [Acinetobacter towneri]|uniref:hypothetical protein n=1 Tax=Acinetobacter towneri TaxID=202956 RepID=UPI001F303877|nr:hypothetical protein [Acinetobacter towneri]UIP26127.1 hypothetical protein LZG54_05435 [Acinetobacter towneri]